MRATINLIVYSSLPKLLLRSENSFVIYLCVHLCAQQHTGYYAILKAAHLPFGSHFYLSPSPVIRMNVTAVKS